MLFKIDENLPVEIAELLNSNGYDASTVNHQNMQGVSDVNLILACRNDKRILITLDTDFADIRTYSPKENNGIILFRIQNQSKRNVLNIFEQLIPKLKSETIDKHLWIVEENKIRIRS